jgi:hypothetical protein
MTTIIHKADSRGHADHGWLNAYHSFSFAGYYDPERIQFGALRVLNDDTIAAGMGFGTHPHDNMEIITIPLEGDLAHKDSMGNTEIIKFGDVQVMSAALEFNIPNSIRITIKEPICCKFGCFRKREMWSRDTNKLRLTPQTVIINFNKFFLQILTMMVFGFIKMPGFIWAIWMLEQPLGTTAN